MSFGIEVEKAWGSSVKAKGTTSDLNEQNRILGQVSAVIEDMSHNLVTITKLVKKLGTSTDTVSVRRELQDVMRRTQSAATETSDVLKHLSHSGQNDVKFRLHQKRIHSDFQGILSRFSELSKLAAQKERQFVAREEEENQSTKTKTNKFGLEEENDLENFLMQDFQNQQLIQREAEYHESVVKEREKGIRYIESTIQEINQIYKDLAFMVNEQGAVIDTIESNVTSAYDRVDSGRSQLIQAAEDHQKSRNRICCLLLILIIVLFILVLLLK
eukprot:c10122_g1_i1.p1 GENE.c10122_g1_i1~~c10122_g1_i1.p1  ORF type:complete len:272 (+),score=96.16 c10122_g1_i1:176-991(+)